MLQKSPKELHNRLSRRHTGSYFQIFPYLTLTSTQRVSRGKESGGRGSGSKACLVQCKDHQSEIKEPPLGSFVFSDERLFEVHWLGLNSPNLSSSQPPSIDTHYLLFSTFAYLTKPGAGRGGPSRRSFQVSCSKGLEELGLHLTTIPPINSFILHPSLTLTGHLTSLAVFMGGVYK